MLDNTPNQPTKFRTKKWAEINGDERRKYNTNSQIKFKTSMIKPSLCDYNDVYILAKGTISLAAQVGDKPNCRNKELVFKIVFHLIISKQYTNR